MKNQNSILIEDENALVEELDLIAKINQDDDGQLLKIVKGEDEGYAGTNLQHVDEILEKKWLKRLLETFEPEKEVAGDEQNKNVAEGQEVWEAATCGVTSAGVKPEATKATLTATTSMLAARRVVTAEAATTTELTEIGNSRSRLDIEIESIRRLMMKVSQKQQTTARKQKNLSKGKKKVEYKGITGGRMQNKIWKPGEK